MTVFPLTFLATTFVPIAGFSPGLRTIAAWNPVSAVAAAVRTLFGNPTAIPADAAWPLRHCVPVAIGGCLLLLAVAIPLTLRTFRQRTDG